MVKNGKVVVPEIAIPANWSEFYPAVGVSHENEKVQVRFGAKEFKFDYLEMKKQV